MTERLNRLSRTSSGRLLIAAATTLIGVGLATLVGLVLGWMAPLPDRVLVGLGLAAMLTAVLTRRAAQVPPDPDRDDG